MSKSQKFAKGDHFGQLHRSWAENPNITHLQLRIGLLMATDVDKYTHTPQRLADRLSADVKAVRKAVTGLVERGLIERLEGKEGGGRGADLVLHWPPLEIDEEDDAPSEMDIMLGRSPERRRASDPGSETRGPTPPPSRETQESNQGSVADSLRSSAPSQRTGGAKAKTEPTTKARNSPAAPSLLDQATSPVAVAYRDRLTTLGKTPYGDQADLLAALDSVDMGFIEHLFGGACKAPHAVPAVTTFAQNWRKRPQSSATPRTAKEQAQAAALVASMTQRTLEPAPSAEDSDAHARLLAMREMLLGRTAG